MKKELTYWMSFSHTPKILIKKKNEIILRLLEKNKSIIDFFEKEESIWEKDYNLNTKEIQAFDNSRIDLPDRKSVV